MQHSPIRSQNCDNLKLEPVEDGNLKGLDEDGRGCNERSLDENARGAISLPAFKSPCKVNSFILASKAKSIRVQNVVSHISQIYNDIRRAQDIPTRLLAASHSQ